MIYDTTKWQLISEDEFARIRDSIENRKVHASCTLMGGNGIQYFNDYIFTEWGDGDEPLLRCERYAGDSVNKAYHRDYKRVFSELEVKAL